MHRTMRMLLLALMLGSPAVAWADADPPAGAGEGGELAAKQRFTREKFRELTDKMLRVADLIRETEPESAAAIQQAVKSAQRAFVDQEMEKVIDLLLRGLPTQAARTETDVVRELRLMLETLRTGILDIDERLKRIKDWKEFKQGIDKLIEEQKALEAKSALHQEADEMSRDLARMAEELDGIVKEQKALLAETETMNAADADLRKLAEARDELRDLIARETKLAEVVPKTPIGGLPVAARAQENIGGRAGELTDKLEKLAADEGLGRKLSEAGADGGAVSKAASSTSMAAKEMGKASKALGELNPGAAARNQEQAIADLKAAEAALSGAIAKASAGTPGGKAAGRQKDLQQRVGQLGKDVQSAADKANVPADAGNLKEAGGEMGKASDKLGGQDPTGAAGHQKEALKKLQDEQYKLAELSRKIMEKAKQPPKSDADAQGKLGEKTGELGEQMDGEEGKPAAPGQPSVSGASKSMGSAAGKLSQGQSGGANKDQKDALDQLDKARKDLEEAIRQEEEMAQAEQLAKLDAMLEQMLKKQQGLTAETKRLAARKGEDGYAREDQLALKEASAGEGRLAEDAAKVGKMLAEDNSTVVFPAIMEEVRRDLADLQERLGGFRADRITRSMQEDVEKNLQEMILAIREELSRRKKEQQDQSAGGGQGGGGGGGGPLVKMDAELRLLRTLQLGINSRTAVVDKLKAENNAPAEELERQHRELADRQQKLKGMAAKMAAKAKAARQNRGR